MFNIFTKKAKQAENFETVICNTLKEYDMNTDDEDVIKENIAKFYGELYLVLDKNNTPQETFVHVLDTMADMSKGLSEAFNYVRNNQ
jgi:hypothetical protein